MHAKALAIIVHDTQKPLYRIMPHFDLAIKWIIHYSELMYPVVGMNQHKYQDDEHDSKLLSSSSKLPNDRKTHLSRS
jgi:hypothetical protein